jgi:predicted RND superfamily exporter protein
MDLDRRLQNFSQVLIHFRWWVLALVLGASAFFGWSSGRLKVNNDYDTWLPLGDKVAEMYRLVDREFSANAMVFVVLDCSDKGVFHKESLALLQKMTRELERLPELFNVTSLTNIVDIRRSEDGIEVRDLIQEIPQSDQELESLKTYVLSREMYVNSVISPDAAYTVVICNIDGSTEEVVSARKVLETARQVAGDHPFYFGGDPALVLYLDQYTAQDMELLLPLALATMVVVLGYGLRRIWGVVLPLGLVALCILWTLGLQALFGLDANILSPSVVVLLIAMGSDYAVHLFNHYLNRGDVGVATAEIASPVAMSAATTVAGLLTFATTRIDILQFFGFELAFGLASACLLSLLLLPVCIHLLKIRPNPQPSGPTAGPDFLAGLLDRMGSWGYRHNRFVLFGVCVAVGVFAAGIPQIRTNVDFVELLPERSPPRLGHDILRDHFSGIYPVSLYLKGDIEDPAVLNRAQYLENFLRSEELLSSFTSINGLIAEENWTLNNVFAIPETREGIANLWFLLEGEEILRTFVTADRTQALVTGMLREPESAAMWHIAGLLRRYIAENLSNEIVVLDPERLPLEERRALQTLRFREAADQIAWLAQGYDKPARYDPAPVFERLAAAFPRVDDGLPLESLWEALRHYLEQETVQVLSPEAVRRVLTGLQGRWKQESRRFPSADEIAGLLMLEAAMTAEDARESGHGLARRALDTLRILRAEALSSGLEDLFPARLVQNKDFRKRVQGVLWTLWSDQPAFFSRQVASIPHVDTAVRQRKEVLVEQAGAPDLFRRFDELLYQSQIQSLVLASVAVLALISITQRSLRRGLASLLCVLAPLAAVLGLMGWTGIPLDYGTVLFGALIIGLGVDGSIHFLTHYRRLLSLGMAPEDALGEVCRHVGRAVVTANGTTCFGFLVLILSKTRTLKYFAAVNSLAILLVTLSVLTLLPAMLVLFHIDDRNREKDSGPT